MIEFNMYESDRFIFEDILIIPTFLSLVGDSLLEEPDFKALITVPTKSARVFQRYVGSHLPYGDVPNIIILDLQTKMMHPYLLYTNRDYQVFSGSGVYLGGLPRIFDAISMKREAFAEYQQGTLLFEDARSECFEVRNWNACYQWLSFMTTNSSRRKGGKGTIQALSEIDNIVRSVSGKSIYVTSEVDVPLIGADGTDVLSKEEENARREDQMGHRMLQEIYDFATHIYLPDELTRVINRIGSAAQNLVVKDVERNDYTVNDFKFLMPTDTDQVYQMSGTGSLDGELAVILDVRFLESRFVNRFNPWTSMHMEDFVKSKFTVSGSSSGVKPESNS